MGKNIIYVSTCLTSKVSLNLILISLHAMFGVKKSLKHLTSSGAHRSNGKPIGRRSEYFLFIYPQYDDESPQSFSFDTLI